MPENQPAMDGPKPAGRAHLRYGCGLMLLCLAAVAVTAVPVALTVARLRPAEPLRISEETTYIIEPLKSDGKQVDYFAALQQTADPANIATDENGYRLIVRALGKSPGAEPAHFAAICQQLGLDPESIRPEVTYRDPHDFLTVYVDGEEFNDALLDRVPPEERSRRNLVAMLEDKLARPWTVGDLPMMAAWLEENGPALDLMARAVRQPTFHVPMVREHEDAPLDGAATSELNYLRSFVHGLGARANNRMATGDIEGAVDDIIACKRLGRHIAHWATTLDMLLGLGFETSARAIGIAGSFDHPPSKAQLQRLIAELGELPPPADLDEKLLFQRFVALDFIQSLAHGNVPQVGRSPHDASPVRRLGHRRVDWNIVAERFNEHFDRFAATGEMPPRVEFGPRVLITMFSTRGRSEHLIDVLSGLLLPGTWDLAVESTRRNICAGQMQRILLAMLLYEREHGTLPPAWSVGADGEPLHSWRVLLLPYLGQEALYANVRLDEPWDSPYNRQFHGEAVPFYRCPSEPVAGPGETTYSVVVGPDMPFEAGEGKRLADFGPHSDDMILLVERAEPACWMDPTREVPQRAAEEGIREHAEPLAPAPPSPNGIGSHHCRGAHFGLRNGAVEFLWADSELEELRAKLRGI